MVCSAHRGSIFSVSSPVPQGHPTPLLHDYQRNIDAYLSTLSVMGGLMGPIAFPCRETSVTIRKKEHPLPTLTDKEQFRLIKWNATVHCSETECTVAYHTPLPPSSAGDSGGSPVHTVAIQMNQQNQIFIRYTSRSKSMEACSLAHDLIWNLGNGRSVFNQHLAINADQFSSTPLFAEMSPVSGSKQDYRKQHSVHSECEGYYRIHGANITNAEYEFEKPIRKLSPAIMVSDPHTRRYMQIYTDYPLMYVRFYHHARGQGRGIQFIPCIPLDSIDLFARSHSRHAFCCCYRFGTLI